MRRRCDLLVQQLIHRHGADAKPGAARNQESVRCTTVLAGPARLDWVCTVYAPGSQVAVGVGEADMAVGAGMHALLELAVCSVLGLSWLRVSAGCECD